MVKNKLRVSLPLSVLLLLPLQGDARLRNEKVDREVGSTKAVKANTGDQAERALHAANVVRQLLNTPESNIPQDLLERGQAIAVIPNLVKAALGVGGMHGKGLVVSRTSSGWGTPAFIDLSGGSFGFQIGVSATDLILVFTQKDGLKGLLEDKLELGGESGVAAGPVGRAAEVGTNVTFDSPIYSYSRSKGLFAGIALKGTVMTIDDSANHRVYGNNVSGTDILLRGEVRPTPVVKPLLEALQRYEPQTRMASRSGHRETVAAINPAQEGTMIARSSHIKKAQEELRESENLSVTGRLDNQTAAKLGVEPSAAISKGQEKR